MRGVLLVVGLVIFLLAWQVGHYLVGRFLPSPYDVARNCAENLFGSRRLAAIGLPQGGYWIHIVSTCTTVLCGVVAGTVLGLAIALMRAMSHVADEMISPILNIIGVVPLLVLAPFFLMWFGVSEWSKLGLVALGTAFVIASFSFDAMDKANTGFVESAYTLGASARQAVWQVSLPAALPTIFGAVRVSLTGAWGLATITELLGSTRGIGRVIIAAWGAYDVTIIVAAVCLLSIAATAFDIGLTVIRSRVLAWE